MQCRPIENADVPALFDVRIATRQNTLSRDELTQLGITVDSVRALMRDTHRGWLCQDGDRVVGFAMGNKATGEMWVIALLPEYEGRGLGGQLLTAVEDWLWSEGWEKIWLTTDIDTSLRAYGFYQRQGWRDWKIEDGDRFMTKTRKNQ